MSAAVKAADTKADAAVAPAAAAAAAAAAPADAKDAKAAGASASAGAGAAAAVKIVSRAVDKYIEAKAQGEGHGATVRRTIGRPELRSFDPFLMLDEFSVQKPAGFPDHPHRGFETVTYMLDGAFEHEDFCGHKGRIESGDLQWMTAGKGILHSEMPARGADGVSHGLQLWVNLSAKDKMCEPAYQELKAAEITTVSGAKGSADEGVTAVVIAGEALGHKSKVYTRNPTYYVHFKMAKGAALQQPIPSAHNAFVYILKGSGVFGGDGKKRSAHHVLTLTRADGQTGVTVEATTGEALEFVLLSGQPIGEPVVQHGPFVMNTQQEIMQAMRDYQSGKNGFERAPGWRSEIGKPITDKYGHDDDDEL